MKVEVAERAEMGNVQLNVMDADYCLMVVRMPSSVSYSMMQRSLRTSFHVDLHEKQELLRIEL
jgi:hypothetical protein